MKVFHYIRNAVSQLFRVYCREFTLVIHDPGLLLFIVFLPFAYPVIYSLIYNPEIVRDVKMVVVDHDRTPLSRELTRRLDATQGAWVTGYAADLGEAKRAMHSHDCYAILEIPEGFQRKVDGGETGNAVMYCEMSLLLRYKAFLMAATDVMLDMGGELQKRKIDDALPMGSSYISDGDLLPIHNVAMGNIESGFDSFIMPAIVVLILHQCIVLVLGMSGGAKREKAYLIGYDPYNAVRSVGLTMAGQTLCYMTLLFLPMIFLLHYVPLIFAFPMESDIVALFAFMLPLFIAAAGVGFCFQAFVWERESVFVLWVVTSVAFLFLSGITWPLYGMSPLWKGLAYCLPSTWGVEGFVRMHTNGATIAQVPDAYTMLWILAAVYMALGYCVQRWIVRPQTLAARRGANVVRAAIEGR